MGFDDSIPTRESLISRLKNWDDQLSWRQFFDLYWRLIYNVSRKAGLNDAEAQDVVQETILTVAKGIHSFKKDPKLGRFRGWLLNITRWRVADQFRKRQPHISADDGGTLANSRADGVPDPSTSDLDALWDENWDKHLMDTALAKVRSQVNPLSYQMFELQVLKQWPAIQVAQSLGVKIGKVYFAKYKISLLIRKEVRQLERLHL